MLASDSDPKPGTEERPSGVSIIIPAFNEASGIGPVLEKLCRVMGRTDITHEIIVVDDGSTDGTSSVISKFPVRVIRHSRNQGYGAALKTGVRAATHETIMILDSDGQHDPADIPRFVELARQHEMVIGVRGEGSHSPGIRRPGKWLMGVVANYLAGMKIPDVNSGFRAFRRELVIGHSHILPNGFSFSTTLTIAVLKEGYDVAWVPIVVAERKGTSSVRMLRDGPNTLLLILRTIALFDPLKVLLPPSIMIGLFGVVLSVYGLIRFRAVPESGILLIIVGIFLFFFGILADQISSLRRAPPT